MHTAYPLHDGFDFDSSFGFRLRDQPSPGVFAGELPLYRHPTDGSLWVGATMRQKYGIEFIVPSSKRFLFVCAVDGRSINTGQRSSGSSSEEGYVVSPPSRPDANVVPGWATGDGDAAAFIFTPESLSYSTRVGSDKSETGVIGVRIYAEKRRRPVFLMAMNADTKYCGAGGQSRSAGNLCGASRSLHDDGGVGTGFGEAVEFNTTTTEFEADSNQIPITISYRYAMETWLVQNGFTRVPVKFPGRAKNPQPFPLASACPTPPGGWRST